MRGALSATARILPGVIAGLCLGACAVSPERVERLEAANRAATSSVLDCPEQRADRCALPGALDRFAELEDAHHVIVLDRGPDALAARIHLIRAARSDIVLQSYILYTDGSGLLLIDELVKAARRGVRVRVLSDALYSIPEVELVAALSRVHANLELRLYNPQQHTASLGPVAFAGRVICCFRSLNHRMHNKLLAADGRHAIVGGRNVADRYFDLDTRTNFLDLELLVSGPAVSEMVEGFDLFWDHPLSRKPTRLRDVARVMERDAQLPPWRPEIPDRVAALAEPLSRPDWLEELIQDRGMMVEDLAYFSDPPAKPWADPDERVRDSTGRIHSVILGAAESVEIMTPYFVMSVRFEHLLGRLDPHLDVRVLTNSLASTDAYPVYAISRRQRGRIVGHLDIDMREFMPFPADKAEFLPRYPELIRERAEGVKSYIRGDPQPAVRDMPGPRVSLHGKAVVVDGLTAVVTSHNLDPRSEFYNTENGVIIQDRAFSQRLLDHFDQVAEPRNSWVVAERPVGLPLIGELNRALAAGSRRLPTLDLWPTRLTRNYQLAEGADPLPRDHPDFREAWIPVGELPEVALRQRLWATAIISRMFGFLRRIM